MSGAHPSVKFYMPGARWLRYTIRILAFALALGWLPLVVSCKVNELQSADPRPIPAMAMDVPYTEVEAREAAELLTAPVLSAAIPVWTPPTTGMIYLPKGDRAEIDAVYPVLLGIQKDLASGKTYDEVASRAENARQILLKRNGDRSFDFYYYGLLAMWAGAGTEATARFKDALLLVDRSLKQNPSDSPAHRRLVGVKTATLYAMGHAALAGDGLETDTGRQEAMEQFRLALRAAGDFPAEGAKGSGQFVDLKEEDHLVNLSSASIWNDLIVVQMHDRSRSPNEIPDVRMLLERAGTVRREATLASNLVVLFAMPPAGADKASLRDRQKAATNLWDAGLWRSGQTSPALTRAEAVFAMLGLQGPTRTSAPGAAQSAVRRAYNKLFQGAANAKTSSFFEPVYMAEPDLASERLDRWLIIREWRRQLGAGEIQAYTKSLDRLKAPKGNDAVDTTFLEQWRTEVQSAITAKTDSINNLGAMSGQEQRAMLQWLIVENGFSVANVYHRVYYAFGPLWPVWGLLWLGTIVLAWIVSKLLNLYVRTFRPLHFTARTKSGSK